MKSTFVIGDIHGCLQEFQELLQKINYNRETHRVVLLGDLMDRGNDSIGCIRLAQELQLECVMGNHEEYYIRWDKNVDLFKARGIKNNMKSSHYKLKLYEKLIFQDLQWMRNLPHKIDLGNNWWAIHAGVEPANSFENQYKDALIHIRYVDENGNSKSLKEDFSQPDNTVFWAEKWTGNQSVIFGHSVHSKSEPRIIKNTNNTCIGIDTGCCYGGKLTAYCLETNEFFQVDAKAEYSKAYFI